MPTVGKGGVPGKWFDQTAAFKEAGKTGKGSSLVLSSALPPGPELKSEKAENTSNLEAWGCLKMI